MNLYGLKIIYQYTVGDDVFYEEQIVTTKAESFDEAYQKAWDYAKGYCDEHLNPDGEKVIQNVYDVADCYLADDEEDEVKEVYSAFKKNRTVLSDEEFIDVLSDGCTAEELKALRYK